MSDTARTPRPKPSPKRLLTALVLVAVLVALALYAGLRSPWGTKHPQVKDGFALRANDENDLVIFDSDDGTQITFGADDIWWQWENRGGHGNPPCLRKIQEETPVEVGIMRVAGPEGGWHQQAVWVKCL